MVGTSPAMQVRIEDVSPVEKKMFVEIPWETVSAKLGNAYRELGKGAALKGFRKGKVPRPVLEQVYGHRINAEAADGGAAPPRPRQQTQKKPIEGRDVTALGDIVGISVTGSIGEHAINQ